MPPLRLDRRSLLIGAATTGAISLASGTLRAKLPRKAPARKEIAVAVGTKAVRLCTLLGSLYTARSGVAVRVEDALDSAWEQLGYMTEHAGVRAGGKGAIDVFGADVAHMSTLAEHGHILRLADQRPIDFLESPLETCRVAPSRAAGGYYGLPFYTNVGMLYRREGATGAAMTVAGLTDLLARRSTATWTAQLSANPGDHGEGLLCNFFEHVLAVEGCDSLITPSGALTDDLTLWNLALDSIRLAVRGGRLTPYRDDVRGLAMFNGGKVEFMRNWPTFVHRAAADEPVAPSALMPLGVGILGGVNLAIGRNTRDRATAQSFIDFMTGMEAQRLVALHGYPPALAPVYGDADVRPVATHLETVKDAIRTARRRPAARFYDKFSKAVVDVVVDRLRRPKSRIDSADLAKWKEYL